MAIAQITYTVDDDAGDNATTTINVPDTFSIAQYTEFGAAMATLVDKILAGKVSRADLCFAVDISGLLNNLAGTGSDVEEVASFQAVSLAGFPVSINVPALDESMVVPGSNQLDVIDPAIAAAISLIENGLSVTGGTIIPSDIAESDVDLVLSATEQTRSSGTRR